MVYLKSIISIYLPKYCLACFTKSNDLKKFEFKGYKTNIPHYIISEKKDYV